MSQEPNIDEETSQKDDIYEKVLKYVQGNNYLVFYILSFVVYMLAFGSETTLGPISYKGQVADHERKLLVGIGTSFLFLAFLIHVNHEFKKRRIKQEIHQAFGNEDRLNDISRVAQLVSSSSKDYQQILEPYLSIADELDRQQRVRSRIVEWMQMYPKDDWINKAISRQFIEDFSPRYMNSNQEVDLRKDIDNCIDILAENLRREQPYSLQHHGFKRSINSRYLYREAMKRIKTEILLSLESEEELDDCREKSKLIIVPFIDVLISNLDDDT